ncbi:THAP-type domain-containing protein, partial [Aphis craccivora]
FPANDKLRRQWVLFAENNGVNARQILATSTLCSRHFILGHDYLGGVHYRRRLLPGAVPSLVSVELHGTHGSK